MEGESGWRSEMEGKVFGDWKIRRRETGGREGRVTSSVDGEERTVFWGPRKD
jgi:hypothetical protein